MVFGNDLFFGSCSGVFYSLNAFSGEERWQYDTSLDGNSNEFHGESLISEKIIITGTDDRNPGGTGHVYAFDANAGKARWKYDVNIGIPGKLNLDNSKIYAFDFDETLHILDLKSGKLLHKIEGSKEKEDGYRFPPSPVIANQHIYLAYRDGHVRSIQMRNYEQAWEIMLPSKVASDSVLYNNSLLIGTEDKSIYELNLKNGAINRRIQTTDVPHWKLLIAKDRLLSLQWNGSVCAGLKGIDLKTGKEVWSQQPPENSEWNTFRPMIWKNLILVGSNEGHLMTFDTQTGTPAWTFKLNGNLRSFGMSDVLIYAGSSNGSLYAISPPI